MIAALAGVAVLTVAGAIAATGARVGRTRLLGLTLALTLAPFLADPFPAPGALAVRVVAALLVVSLLRATLLDSGGGDRQGSMHPSGASSAVGWPSDALLAAAAAVLGFALTQGLVAAGAGDGTPISTGSGGPVEIVGAVGFTLVTLGASSALLGGTSGRLTVGLLFLLQGVGLIRLAIADTPSDFEQLAFVAFLVAIAAGGSALVEGEAREARVRTVGQATGVVTFADGPPSADHDGAAGPGAGVPALEAVAGPGAVGPSRAWRRRR